MKKKCVICGIEENINSMKIYLHQHVRYICIACAWKKLNKKQEYLETHAFEKLYEELNMAFYG